MRKFALLTAPLALSLGMAALCADNVVSQHTGELAAQQNGATGQTAPAAKKHDSSMPMRQVTPEVEPKVTHWADPFVTAEFIYWKAYEDGLDYATTGAARTTTQNASKGRVHDPDFDFQPGFKLGAGVKFSHDGWDLYANWTWLNEYKGSGHAHSSANSLVNSSWTTTAFPLNGQFDVTSFFAERASVDWSMHFNALDLELGRNFYISRYLTLRPHFGLKFGWIDQDYKAKYKEIPNEPGSVYKLKMDQDFFGVGIRTGLDTVWYFAKHWGVYGDVAFSALWSDFDSDRKDTFASSGTAKFHNLNTRNHFITLTEVLELGVGLRYDTTFFIGDYAFYMQAGWEEQIWFNQNQFYDLSDDVSGNLAFQGLSVKAGLMF